MNNKLRGRYYLREIIQRLKLTKTNEEVAELLGCSLSTVKYAVRYKTESTASNVVDGIFGKTNTEYLRLVAANKCKEIFLARGWDVCEVDPKSVYDILAVNKNKVVKVQVRSSSQFFQRG